MKTSKNITKMKNCLFALLMLVSISVAVCSCKAWRTISTTATCVQTNDSTKSTTSITTKTVEEYQGIKK